MEINESKSKLEKLTYQREKINKDQNEVRNENLNAIQIY
jgi:hypothetical protein